MEQSSCLSHPILRRRYTGSPLELENLKALLVRKNRSGHSSLARRLGTRGCECFFATSIPDVAAQLDTQIFHLVLAPIRLEADTLYPLLVDRLAGSETTLFYSLPVEDGAWWLPALRLGQNCFGTAAIHRDAFVAALEKTIDEIRHGNRPADRLLAKLGSHTAPLFRDSGTMTVLPEPALASTASSTGDLPQ